MLAALLPAGLLLVGCSAAPAALNASSSIAESSIEISSAITVPTPTSTTTTQPTSTATPTTTTQPTTTDTPTTTTQPTTTATETTAAAFSSSISEIDAELAARMATSWRPGCPVELADLSYVTVSYLDFQGETQQGELVVARTAASAIVSVFETLYLAEFPIFSMRLVDDFSGDDDASMNADNTSAFNCRAVTGGSGFSEHSTGSAIDINPRENPYVSGAVVLPASGEAFLDRPAAPGVIQNADVVVQAFAEIGWSWGGQWSSPVDYQHFSASGR